MNTLTAKINEIRPLFFEYLPQMFPAMGFRRINAKTMGSEYHIDGTNGTGKKADRTYFKADYPFKLHDTTRSTSEDILTKYQQEHGYKDLWDAVTALCNMMGVTPPERSVEAEKAYRERQTKLSLFEASAKRQAEALRSEEGRATYNYLIARGWTEDEISRAIDANRVGYISEAEAQAIGAPTGIGRGGYTLSIPYYTSGEITTFKYRTITPTEGLPKYKLHGGSKEGLYNLYPTQRKSERVIVVEGELDALRAELNGIDGVVATSGNGLTENLLNTAVRRGFNKVTLLLDADNAGAEFCANSISVANKKGIAVLVAVLPASAKDTDEYFSKGGTKEGLSDIIKNAYKAGRWKVNHIITEYKKKYGEDLTDEQAHELTERIIDFVCEIPDPAERDLASSEYSYQIGGMITAEAILAKANKKREAQMVVQRDKEVKAGLAKAYEEAKNGNIQTALSLMEDVQEANKQKTTAEKYSFLLKPITEAGFAEAMKNKAEGIETEWQLENPNRKGEFYPLRLPAGAITMVVAPTSHGKSTILQNLALQTLKAEGEGVILYFSYEEDKEAVTMQFLNKYAGIEVCRNYDNKRSNNLDAIRHYWTSKDGDATKFFQSTAIAPFEEMKGKFFRDVLENGKLLIYDADLYAYDLAEAVKFVQTQQKVKAVFVDYVQLLYIEGNKKARSEELMEICKVLMSLSITANVPVIVSAQANREVRSPLDMSNQRIADASGLEKSANNILFVWNTDFGAERSENTKDLKEWEDKHTKLGKEHGGGKMFIKQTKNRGGVVNLEATLNYNGNTGRVTQIGVPPQQDKQQPQKGNKAVITEELF